MARLVDLLRAKLGATTAPTTQIPPTTPQIAPQRPTPPSDRRLWEAVGGIPYPLKNTETGQEFDTLLKDDQTVWLDNKQIGEVNSKTGEFQPKEPTLWDKVLYYGSRAVEYAMTVFSVPGQVVGAPMLLGGTGEEYLPEDRKVLFETTKRLMRKEITREEAEEIYKKAAEKAGFGQPSELLPGGKQYELYRQRPMWQQALAEAPGYIASVGVPGAMAIRGALAPAAARPGVAAVAPKVARAVLAPAAGFEWGIGKTVNLLFGKPIGAAWAKFSERQVRKAFEKTAVFQREKAALVKSPAIRDEYYRAFKEYNKGNVKTAQNIISHIEEGFVTKRPVPTARAVVPRAPEAPPPKAVVPTKPLPTKVPEAPPVKPTVPEVKEPWQMTQKEYVRPPYTSPAMHKFGVEKALSEGKPVPAEVLAEYPDLKPPTVEAVPAVAKPAPKPVPETVKLETRRNELKELITKPIKQLPKGTKKIELRQELKEVSAKLVPVEKKLRQKIMATAIARSVSPTQRTKIFKDIGGSRHLSEIGFEKLNKILPAIQTVRPTKIKGKTVITEETEGKIQSLKQSLIAEENLTEEYFDRIVKQLKLKTLRYENNQRFITEPEGKSVIRAMNDEVEIGYLKQTIEWEKGLAENPEVAKMVADYQKRVVGEGQVYFQGKPADASILKDMRFFADDLQVRTGEPFYHIYFLMNRTSLDNRMIFTRLKMKQVKSTPDFRKILDSKKGLKRINDYIAAKNKWLDVKSPKDITPEEIRLANALEEQLFEFQPDFRYHRFLEYYSRFEGSVNKIKAEIPDAALSDIKVAVNIYESQGAGKLRAYLDTRTWGVIEQGFEPHYTVNPKLAMRKLRTAFPTGRFKSREGVEFYPADKNIVERVDRYTQQMLTFNLRPYVRRMEQVYRDAIPKLKNPDKVRGALSMSANEMMGYVERGGPLYSLIIKFAGQAYATVFGTMPILPFRNLFQNLAFHPDKSALVDPRNRKLSQGDWEFYHTNVSQMEAIPRDLLLAEEGGLPLLDRMNRFIHRLNIYGASDSKINRVWSFWGSLNKAERALKAYKADKNIKKFISGSGMAEMTLTQQMDILKILNVDEARAIREIALEITNNVHFLYDRSQRAFIEMGGFGRIFGSLVIFPRSVVQRILNQFKPLDPSAWAPAAKKKRAMKVLLSMLVGSIAANYLFEKATGRKGAPYNPLNILQWSPGGLALGSVTAITDVIGTIFRALSGSEFARSELPATMERAGDTMIPFYKLIMTNLEAAVDLKYIDRLAYRELRTIIEKKMVEMGFLDEAYEPNREWYEAERSWEWRIKHAIFGTEPEPPPPLEVAVKELPNLEKQLGEFILAEDSDDGYVYEMVDLGADIRKLIKDVKPEDITVENNFSPMVVMYKEAETFWDTHYYPLPASDRPAFREQPIDINIWTEAYLFVWGKLTVLRNPASSSAVDQLIEEYNIPLESIPGKQVKIPKVTPAEQPIQRGGRLVDKLREKLK